MPSPINDFIGWFTSIPVEHQHDIAALVATTCPGFECVDAWQAVDLPGDFMQRILELRTHRYREVGLALALRGSVELLVVSRRSSLQAWLSVEASGSNGAAAAAHDAAHIQAWLATCATWHALYQKALSDDALNGFLGGT